VWAEVTSEEKVSTFPIGEEQAGFGLLSRQVILAMHQLCLGRGKSFREKWVM
jgi:hypothetical protein